MVGYGVQGFVVAAQGEGVGLFAGDVVVPGDALGGEAHGEVRVGVVLHQPGVGADFVAPHGDHAHGFGSAGDDDFSTASADAFGGHGDGLQAGGAEAVNRHGRGGDGQAGA